MTPRGVGNERGQQIENKLKMDIDHLWQHLGGDGDNSAFLLATGRVFISVQCRVKIIEMMKHHIGGEKTMQM